MVNSAKKSKLFKGAFELVKKGLLKFTSLFIVIVILSVFFVVPTNAQAVNNGVSNELVGNVSYTYADYLEDNKNYSNYKGTSVKYGIDSVVYGLKVIDVAGVTAILNNEENPKVSFSVFAPEDGFYQISSKFIFLSDTGFEGKRKVSVDGLNLFMEANNIAYYRSFIDVEKPYVNSIGDEVRPTAKEIVEWKEEPFFDNLGRYSRPLTFALSKGKHIITIEFDTQDIAIEYILLSAPDEYPSYDVYKKNNSKKDKGLYNKYEAEDSLALRNVSSVGLANDGDPTVYPSNPGYIVMNTVGGYAFRKGGQSVTFDIDVKEAGYYCLNFRGKQNWNNRMNSYRRIEINGEVPFKELECVAFSYSSKWENYILGNENEPYEIYLNKGKNKISLTAVLGSNTNTIHTLEIAVDELSSLIREIMFIAGSDPDVNYDYELVKNIPNLKQRLNNIINYIDIVKTDCCKQNDGEQNPMGNSMDSSSTVLREMVDNPKEITKRMGELNSTVTSLGNAMNSLQEQPLQIDYLEIYSSNIKISDKKSTFFQKVYATFKSFLVSFSKDYASISSNDGENKNSVINVWVGRGTERAEILKELTDSMFTSKTGIAVNFNSVPNGALANTSSTSLLLLSINAGTQPDVALGCGNNIPTEYAVRGVLEPLSDLSGYDDLISKLPAKQDDGLMLSYKYNGVAYGIPETINFMGLFYRTDIIERLGISIPKTYTELFNKVIPVLYENGMQFSFSRQDGMFVLGYGGSYYKTDDKGRTISNLDSEECYKAFKLMTDAYILYGCPIQASFFNRFRTGEMPLGIGDSTFYMDLIAAAPELSGKWSVAPIPGIENDDGNISTVYNALGSSAAVILKGSKKDASWEFVKWWMSDEAQIAFGREVESRIGVNARWFSANKSAFLSLPWESSIIEAANYQWEHTKEVKFVPGNYFANRYINNCWSNVVIAGRPLRESLEEAANKISKELIRKNTQLEKKKNRKE